MITRIYISDKFAAQHRWVDAPEEVSFLRDFHRHLFHVVVHFDVEHNNREKEFFILQAHLRGVLKRYAGGRWEKSCEKMAEEILASMQSKGACSCTVSEDGENGAIAMIDNQPEQPKLVSECFRPLPFLGYEAEGPNKGSTVLFIPSVFDLSNKGTRDKLLSIKAERIYYGAGNFLCESITEELGLLLDESPIPIDIEATPEVSVAIISFLIDKPKLGNVVCSFGRLHSPMSIDYVPPLYLKSLGNYPHKFWIKWINEGSVFWQNGHTDNPVIRTSLNDPFFKQDKTLTL